MPETNSIDLHGNNSQQANLAMASPDGSEAKAFVAMLVNSDGSRRPRATQEQTMATPTVSGFTATQLSAMKVPELKQLCRTLKLTVGGKKADLVQRLSNSEDDAPFKIKRRSGSGAGVARRRRKK